MTAFFRIPAVTQPRLHLTAFGAGICRHFARKAIFRIVTLPEPAAGEPNRWATKPS